MSNPSTSEFLPGVAGPETVPPVPVCDTKVAVDAARRRRNLRDLTDGLLLLALDYMFLIWPNAHVPFLTRSTSMTLLIALHVIVIGYWIIARELPPLRAKRIASTWAPAERARLSRR